MWNKQLSRRFAALLLGLAVQGTGTAGTDQTLQELVTDRRCDNYVPVTQDQLRLAEAAFVTVLQDPAAVAAGHAVDDWQELGFRLRYFSVGNASWLLLYQTAGRCSGQGLYLVRQDAVPELALQVPHGYFDRYTDDIAAGLLQAPLRLIAFNTARRHYTRNGSTVDADLAHRDDNLFTALTRAFARVFPRGRLVQLHGFNPDKRKSAAGRSAAAIVSTGSVTPSVHSTAMAACLQQLLGRPVRLFPRDIRELGGTRNVQGRQLRGDGHSGFVHLELDRKTREQLRVDDRLRNGFGTCLYDGMPMP